MRSRYKIPKRLLSLFLAVIMCLATIPATAATSSEIVLDTEAVHTEESIGTSENEPAVEETESLSETTEQTETHPECNCGTDDESIHTTTCTIYVRPENPVCYCVEQCGVENQNFWCDICGFDVTACEGGEDEGVLYAYAVGETFNGYLHLGESAVPDKNVTYTFTVVGAAESSRPEVELTGVAEGSSSPTTLILTDTEYFGGGTWSPYAADDADNKYKIVSIGANAFKGNQNLTKVNLDGSFVTQVKQSAFENCTALTSLDLTGVQTIGNRAFYACGVTSLGDTTALDGVVSIGDEAFADCAALETLYLPASVQEMGNTVFEACSKLSSLTLQNGITTLGIATFVECRSLSLVNIPNSITVIPGYLFKNCVNLKILNLPEGVTEIQLGALENCNLTTLTIPNSVQIIGENAFSSNKKLTSVIIPAGVATVEYGAFSYCTSLTTVTVNSSETNFESSVFINCSALMAVIFADGEAPTFVADGTQDTFPSQLHQLTVEDDTGDGMYVQGRSVTLTYTGEGDFLEWRVTSGDATLTNAANANTTLTMGSHSSTVTPILSSYTITYDANGGDSNWLPGNMTAKYGEQIVLPERQNLMNKDNADFQGWMIEGTLYQPGDTYTVTGNVTVYAHWLSYFKLWFVVDQTTGRAVTKYAYEPDYQFTLPECDYEIYENPQGKNFKAWLIDDVEYKARETITLTKNAYVYPVWEDAVTGTVTFSPGDEDATGNMEPITVEAGTTITLPEGSYTSIDDDLRFYGWKINGVNYKPGDEYVVKNDVTAEAIWELDETVSVDISWGAMEFTYSDGTWNPETHSYEGAGWTAVGNTITVVNNGNVDVKATARYGYYINLGCEYIWNASEAILTPDGDNKQFTFVLSFVGKPNQYFEKRDLGIVHIQISRTD